MRGAALRLNVPRKRKVLRVVPQDDPWQGCTNIDGEPIVGTAVRSDGALHDGNRREADGREADRQ